MKRTMAVTTMSPFLETAESSFHRYLEVQESYNQAVTLLTTQIQADQSYLRGFEVVHNCSFGLVITTYPAPKSIYRIPYTPYTTHSMSYSIYHIRIRYNYPGPPSTGTHRDNTQVLLIPSSLAQVSEPGHCAYEEGVPNLCIS